MNVVEFAVETDPGEFGIFAVLIMPAALNGPHPYLFCALTFALYYVPPMIFKEVVKVSAKLGVEKPTRSVQTSSAETVVFP